jgi:hypothetical protein
VPTAPPGDSCAAAKGTLGARGTQHQHPRSVHGADQVVDILLAVARLAALDVVQPLAVQAAARARQLEGPQEVVGLLEGGPRGVDLVDLWAQRRNREGSSKILSKNNKNFQKQHKSSTHYLHQHQSPRQQPCASG